MRFTKGKKVEVLNMKDLSPSGSWRLAKIISGNGHTYLVRYNQFVSDNSPAVERVPRKAIRPCPPADSKDDWAVGDQIEVFEDQAWKPAEVSMVLVEDRYLLKLLDSSQTCIIHKSFMRTWQSWQNNHWVVVQKEPRKNANEKNSLCKGGNLDCQSIPFKRAIRKRRVEPSPTEESSTKGTKKSRAIKMSGGHAQISAGNVQEKAGGVSFGQTMLDDKLLDSSFHDRHSGSESTSSSVGSCSISNNGYSSPDHYVLSSNPDFLNLSDHPETFRGSERESSSRIAEVIHQLELQALRSVMKAFHASGPAMSWERAELLTTLCQILHVSAAEFSMEIKKLISK
ncbi:hypothetical protein Cni_G17957 [Canna indica]|uniref:ENT domain-containing protein n=1 Tax=Canna indica TaxID=4628 RepID=A0AAQ3KIC4_9LILI|nr:hypothetical protein Cni_G17957 [Canna indica]